MLVALAPLIIKKNTTRLHITDFLEIRFEPSVKYVRMQEQKRKLSMQLDRNDA